MLTVEEALETCLRLELPRRVEAVPLAQALGRVLAEPVETPLPVPHWDNSAMDGFALRAADTATGDVVLRVLETIPAGRAGRERVVEGTCSRIMTGAPVPDGADAVVMVEDTTEAGDGAVRVRAAARPGQHIRRKGEEIPAGATLLEPGSTLGATALGLCASVGRTELTVAVRPRVAILSTGDEVVSPGQPLGPAQIWSSNAAALVGLVAEAGGEPVDCGNAPDDFTATRAAFRRALDVRPDLVVSTGGVSVGDFDLVKQALAEEGADMRFWKVRLKPGRPLALGVLGGVPAFGLPGNPVSTMVGFLQFVRPLIRRALGDPRPYLPVVDAVLAHELGRKSGRNEMLRVLLRWEGGGLVAETTGPQGSGMASSMALAHGLLLVDAATEHLPAGSTVPVQVTGTGFLASEKPGYRWA